jgi:hypothetical protein
MISTPSTSPPPSTGSPRCGTTPRCAPTTQLPAAGFPVSYLVSWQNPTDRVPRPQARLPEPYRNHRVESVLQTLIDLAASHIRWPPSLLSALHMCMDMCAF